ncbi:unnamed protein product [Meganyctiphanes norvegica]|uniref:Uncharacterized protein n=1 Tax=Meganyctiphanes norvegica TaxID=48144 RepID=A0AAV2RP01_MEGNR
MKVILAVEVLFTALMYLLDVVFDLQFMKKMCCHDLGTSWTAIINPTYCTMTASLTFGSSIVCNAVAFKQFLGEFKNTFIRLLFAVLALLQWLPFMWYIYCICALCCTFKSSKAEDLIMGSVTVKVFEAIFEGMGQMCLKMYMVMENEQLNVTMPVGTLSFTECKAPPTAASPSHQPPVTARQLAGIAHVPIAMLDHVTYIGIILSLLGVSYTIVKWVSMYMKRGLLWRLGYVFITLIAVGSRVYLMSTLGTYWDTKRWLFINFYWLAPVICCNIASMIYTCIVSANNFSLGIFLRRCLSGTCDFLSKDGLPTSVSYLICAVVFNAIYWPNIHLQIGLAMNAIVLIVNVVFSFFVSSIFKRYYDPPNEKGDDIEI